MNANKRLANLTPKKRALLLAKLRQRRQSTLMERSQTIPLADRTQPIPLSFAQQRLWFIDQLEPNSALYNMVVAIRLTGTLNVGYLQQSLTQIVTRHETLRTTFHMVDDSPVQLVHPPTTPELPIHPIADEVDLKQWIDKETVFVFDLQTGPLIHMRLLRSNAAQHLLLVTMHHIISDGWSIGVFINELSQFYKMLAQGQTLTWPELPIQYTDFTVWQRDYLSGQRLAQQLAFWHHHLDGAPELLELPTDYPRPHIRSQHGAFHAFALDMPITTKLNQLAQLHQATLFMVLLAAFNVLLARYSRQTDIIVGTPIANRSQPELEELIGFFANTLVLRTNLDGNPSFADLLAQVRRTALAAYNHQDIPFEQLVDELKVTRSLSHTPLFQVMLLLQPAESRSYELPNLTAAAQLVTSPFAKFDLTLELVETDVGLEGRLAYRRDLFAPDTIARMAGHLTVLLAAIAAQPSCSVQRLMLLTEEECNQIKYEWNETAFDYGPPQTIQALFEQQVAQTPDALALVFEQTQLTYAQLNVRANQLAHHLISLGIEPDMLIAIMMERSIEMVVALLAVLKAGGAYVPIDPSYPTERIRFMLSDCAACIVLKQAHLQHHDTTIPHVDVDQFRPTTDTNNPVTATTPSNLAYVIYTSGSTGWPKGVLIPQQNLYNLVRDNVRRFAITPQSRVLHAPMFGFDVGVGDLFMTLCAGATLYMPDREQLVGRQLINQLQWSRATHVSLTPSGLSTAQPQPLPHLQTMIVAGEVLPELLVRAWVPYTTVWNAYGPTESTIYATAAQCHAEDDVHIGRPIDNVNTYILNTALQLVPIGVAGELYIGGVQLANGYLNRPKLTIDRFIQHPEFGRLYKTGDLCRWRSDGTIDFLGRSDFQVKIRGFRIELSEIEAVLLAQENVQEAVVIAREENGNSRLIAYLVGEADSSTLRQQLRQRLPEYMLPAVFVLLDRMPLNPNGKLDRRALPAPSECDITSSTQFELPRTTLEAELAAIWADCLQLEAVGIHDNFFELGGHSLLATQVVARIRQRLHIDLPLRNLFAQPTIAELSAIIQLQGSAGEDAEIVAIPRTGPLPLSFGQQRLWFLNQFDGKGTQHNLLNGMRLLGKLNLGAFTRSLQIMLARHEMLRTTFVVHDGDPIQIIHSTEDVQFERYFCFEDLQNETRSIQQTRTKVITTELQNIVFDLATGPLVRWCLLRLDGSTHLFYCAQHHIITDGWSVGIFFRELAALYNAFELDLASPLPPLLLQYADYAAWQRKHLQEAAFEAHLAYWRAQLIDSPTLLALPTDRPRPVVRTYRGGSVPIQLPAELGNQLQELSQAQNATLFMTLLAVWAVLLARYSRQSQVLIGTPIANRQRMEFENLIGFFVNTLVLKTDIGNNPKFIELLAQVKECVLEAYAHQNLPFEKVVDALVEDRDTSYSPLFQVMFAWQNTPQRVVKLRELSLEPIHGDTDNTAQFDLTLSLAESADAQISGVLNYNKDLFDESTIERMVQQFITLLTAVVRHPDRSVLQLQMLTKRERHQIVHTWNNTTIDFGQTETIQTLFEKQVDKTPDAIALEYDNELLTYRQLNTRANRLAHHLINLGVCPDAIVAVMMERSLEMIVALLAVLKAGGAYVPIDPNYPVERVAFMLTDCAAQIVIKQAHLDVDFSVAEILDFETLSLSQLPTSNPRTTVTASHLAYVIYTSGSTGLPKGVLIEHGGAFNVAKAQAHILPNLATGSRLLQLATLGFDAATAEIMMALLHGATLVLAPATHVRAGEPLAQLLIERGITHVTLVPSTMQTLPAVDLPHLQCLIVAGEACPVHLVRRWARGRSFFNFYGPTESPIWTTSALLSAESSVHIGHPIPNRKVYILDEVGMITPIGVVGELYIGGSQLARGYLNRPKLTAERFIEHPELGKLYKTGDLCRWLPNGHIDFLGRIDSQVKIRGFRIELGEIENVLLAHEMIQEAAIVVHEHDGAKQLTAYYVGMAEQADLRQLLAQRLPSYMQPTSLVALDGMPLTPNGKLDRRRLPAPNMQGRATNTTYVAPRTDTEERLCAIWESALNVRLIGIKDNFFALGGHSLLAVQLLSEIEQCFGVGLPLTALFQQPSVANLARLLESPIEIEQGQSTSGFQPIRSKPHTPSTNAFICAPGIGATTMYLQPLSAALGDHVPFYAIEPRGLDGTATPHSSVEAAATYHIEAIRSYQQDNPQLAAPFYLGGHSFGGQVAFEMAVQLEQAGVEVGGVLLFDTHPHENLHIDDELQALLICEAMLQMKIGHPPTLTRAQLETEASENRLTRCWMALITTGALPNNKRSLDMLRGLVNVGRTNLQTAYAPTTSLAAPIHLFLAQDDPSLDIDALVASWQPFGDLTVHFTPGMHGTMLNEPHVYTLAKAVRKCLT